ncbi:hypothetical protein [Arcobacter roscoffensis]|uniref:Uncharacterized protein n=1 Tax=Arcobacter roscoffensis TaxID=2961520 RepID=A0ABY5E9B1_9BACT|nr:hypothetical protein [Arcobacter roscoffensis]UTJ07683.1 hypothetical protein NJU99_06200 [Arcobacter roscoffensis]
MSNIEKLEKVLKEEFIPELDESLLELANITQSWKATSDDKEEFEDLKEMKKFFEQVVEDLDNKDISEEEAVEILEALNEMRLDK